MKRIIQKPLALMAALLAGFSASAYDCQYDFDYGGLHYSILSETERTVMVTCMGPDRDYFGENYVTVPDNLIIPQEVGYDGATYTVAAIDDEAFSGFKNLTSVTIPNSVTEIGGYAFSGCAGLTSVIIPASVTDIYGGVFSGCASLREIEVDSDNRNYRSIGGVLYTKDLSALIQYPCGSSAASFEIPNSVKIIRDEAFAGCAGLKSVVIHDSVAEIGDGAFSGCAGLRKIEVDSGNRNYRSVGGVLYTKDMSALIRYPSESPAENFEIPNSVTEIDEYTFYKCAGLKSVTIPASVTSIAWSVFSYCPDLRKIEVDSGNRNYRSVDGVLYTKDMSALVRYPCGSPAENFEIPDSVECIDSYAFDGCAGLTSVTIPASVTTITDFAFSDCTKLTEIEVDSGNRNYRSVDGVLYTKDMSALVRYPCGSPAENFEIPGSVAFIFWSAFSSCDSLKSVTIPASVTSIGNWAFQGCDRMTEINCKSPAPPEWKEYTNEIVRIDDKILKNAALYVPTGSKGNYEEDGTWKDFVNIKERNF